MRRHILAAVCAAQFIAPSYSAELRHKTDEFASVFGGEFRQIGGKINITSTGCLEQKRAVCSYKAGDFGLLMVTGDKKKGGAEEITLICTSNGDDVKTVACVNSYLAIIRATAPEISKDNRSTILSSMIRVLEVSNETRVKTENVEFILQKITGAGLWFHAKAVD